MSVNVIDIVGRTVAPLVALFALSLAATGVGRVVQPGSDRVLRLLAAPLLGWSLFGVASLGVLLLGLPAWCHLGVPGIGFVVAWRHRTELLGDLTEFWRQLAGVRWATASGLILLSLLVLPTALGPVVDWDSLTFHDVVVRQLLDAGRWFVPPDNLHIAQLGLAHLATIPLRVLSVDAAGALLSWGGTCWALVCAVILAHHLAGTRAAWLAVAGMAGSPILLLVAGTPRVDTLLLAPILTAMVALCVGRAGEGQSRASIAALVLGVAAGTKYHGLAFAAVTAPFVLILARREGFARQLRSFALALCLPLPMLLVNTAEFGSPVFPFLAPPTLEPWLATLVGSTHLPGTFDSRFLGTVAGAREHFSLLGFLFDPARLTVEVEGMWYRPSLLLMLLPLAVLARPWQRTLTLLIPAIAYSAVVLGISPETNLRYLIPGLAPLIVLTAVGTAALLERADKVSLGRPGLLVALAVSLVILPGFAIRWRNPAGPGYLLGRADIVQFRQAHPDPTVRMLVNAETATDPVKDRDGHLLLLFEARGGAFDGPTYADTRSVYWPILAQTELADTCLRDSGISHVLVNSASLQYYLRRGADVGPLRLPELDHFVQRCLDLVSTSGPYAVFKVATPGTHRPEMN